MKKGFSLVEVVVALAVFVVSLVAILSCYFLGVKAYQKQTEYLYFETICLDIDKVYDKEEDWQVLYFGQEKFEYYYNSDYQLVETEDKYTLSVINDDNNNLIISIYNNNDNYFVIENLNYGKGV